ncbi:MAG TPA: acyltransferase [Ktedonobacterales bacterium]|nr:acyltransferase [Ktedonobacterales bacterium]
MLLEGKTSSKRPHLYELDRLRVVTIFSVIAVHVLSKTAFLDTSPFALQVQNAFVTALHFTREIFMFVTAFALVYVYYGKPFAIGRFWKRRGLGVVLPYVIWSAIYIWVTLPSHALPLFWHTLWWDLLTGNASYQLYYILLTIQFYLLFPLFLVFLRRVQRHPWLTLAVSFLLEVITLFVIATYGQNTSLTGNALLAVNLLQDRFVLDYQFYFVLGGLTALYMEEVRAFVLRHQAWMIGGMLAAFLALELHYLAEIQIEHRPILTAVAVMQPIMAFYSLAAVAFFYWYAYRRVTPAPITGLECGSRIWGTLSNTSFGIYLVHPLFLAHILPFVAALSAWPVLVLVPLTWGITTGASVAFCVLLLNIPLFSRLVGREQPAAPALAALRRVAARQLGGGAGKRLPLRALARREEG